MFTQDAKTIRGKFKPSRAAEAEFYRQLKKVARYSGHIIEMHARGARLLNEAEMTEQLAAYAKKLTPWATRQSAKLLEQVQKSNKRAYQNKSKKLGLAFSSGLGSSDVAGIAYALLQEQVELIKSIPIEAAERAQRIAFEAALTGTRAQANSDTIRQLEEEMGFSTQAATARAYLIARTETARANSAITEARARAVGSGQYRWHNSGDGAVRESHRRYRGRNLQGMIFSWDAPPTLSDGMTGHPGTFPNCRCFPEPIFENE